MFNSGDDALTHSNCKVDNPSNGMYGRMWTQTQEAKSQGEPETQNVTKNKGKTQGTAETKVGLPSEEGGRWTVH